MKGIEGIGPASKFLGGGFQNFKKDTDKCDPGRASCWRVIEDGILIPNDKKLFEVVEKSYKGMRVMPIHPKMFILNRAAYGPDNRPHPNPIGNAADHGLEKFLERKTSSLSHSKIQQ